MIFYLPEKRCIAEFNDCFPTRVQDDGQYRISFWRDTQPGADLTTLPAIFAEEEIDLALRLIAEAVGKAKGRVAEVHSEDLKRALGEEDEMS